MKSDVKALLGDMGIPDFPYVECRRASRADRAIERWGLLVATRTAYFAGLEGRNPGPVEVPLPLVDVSPAASVVLVPPTMAVTDGLPSAAGGAKPGRSLLDTTRNFAAFGPRAEGGHA